MLNRDFIEKIEEMSKNEIVEHDKFTYTTKQLHRLREPEIMALRFDTIKGVCDAIKCECDKYETPLIVIADENCISVYSNMKEDRNRDLIYRSNADIPDYEWGSFQSQEETCIELKSKFVQSDNLDNVFKLISNISNSNVKTSSDDGFSQSVETSKGISLKEEVPVDSIIKLKPYRTFNEVEQVESEFLIRFREGRYSNGVEIAFFNADGGAWKLEAKQNVMNKIHEELKILEESGKVIITQ